VVESTVLTSTSLLLVAAALIRDPQGRVLLTQRKPKSHMALHWEFPGGKIETGESPEMALARELHEEIGILVDPVDMEPWTFVSHAYDHFHLLMPLFHCHRFRGHPHVRDTHNWGWFTLEQLEGLSFPPADAPLFEQLKALPIMPQPTRT
jgi:8-oxo-dGTP diphosphatase